MTDAFSEFWFSILLQSTVLLVVTLWLCWRETDPRVRDRLWSAGHIMILFLWLVGFLFPHIRLFSEPVWLLTDTKSELADTVLLWIDVIGTIWALGASLMVTGIALSLIQGASIVRRSKPWCRSIPKCDHLLQSVRIQVRISPFAVTPFCWQFHRPTIVLPEAVAEFPDSELRAILYHEAGHLLARHPLRLFLQRLVETLLWFHPLVWYTSRQAALQRELVADRFAARDRQEAVALLNGLLRLSEYPVRQVPELPAGLAFASQGSMMRIRVDGLIAHTVHQWSSAERFQRAGLYVIVATILTAILWLPINPQVSGRSMFSPWPHVSAITLKCFGVSVRDFEIDNHRRNAAERHLPTADVQDRG